MQCLGPQYGESIAHHGRSLSSLTPCTVRAFRRRPSCRSSMVSTDPQARRRRSSRHGMRCIDGPKLGA
eukprot:scaffold7235_cov583-Prasinococcus_capsulatus_cf.AAC.4